jgi:hypothetical protein
LVSCPRSATFLHIHSIIKMQSSEKAWMSSQRYITIQKRGNRPLQEDKPREHSSMCIQSYTWNLYPMSKLHWIPYLMNKHKICWVNKNTRISSWTFCMIKKWHTLVHITALLYTWNEHNGHLCCPDHNFFRPPLSHFVIRVITKFVLLIFWIRITFLWAMVPSFYFVGHA